MSRNWRLVGGHGGVPAAVERELRQLERERVGGEGRSAAAVEVAAELVEDDDRGEEMVGRVAPRLGLGREQVAVQRGEAVADAGVERVGLGEPAVAADLAEPEIEHGGRGVGGQILDSHASAP